MTLDAEISAAGFEPLGDAQIGGTSTVVRARRRAGGDVVAVKVLDRVDRRRLDREVDIGGRIAHPHLALPIDAGVLEGGRPFVVVPWVDGRPLSALLRSGASITHRQALVIVDDVIGALGALHRNGVVHRDVSPSNVMITAELRAVLIDVGLGRSAEDVTVTASGDLAGTPRYLAPELIRGEPATPAADQYALALVAFEILAGESPFPDGMTAATALHHQLHTAPTPLDEIDPTLGRPVADALDRALAKDPGERWPDIESFGVALRRAEVPAVSTTRRRAVAAGAGILVASAAAAGFAVLGDDGGRSDDASSSDPVTISPATDAVATTAVPSTAMATTTPTTPAPATTVSSTDEALGLTFGELAATFPTSMTSASPAGAADELECNLLAESSFEQGFVTENFFNNPDASLDGAERVVTSGGVDGSGVLVVGEPGRYGRYAEWVPITPGVRYELSAAITPVGELFEAALLIGWLDADFALLDVPGGEVSLVGAPPGRVTVQSDAAPPEAAYAVPQVVKDGSPGVVLADELVFAPIDAGCRP